MIKHVSDPELEKHVSDPELEILIFRAKIKSENSKDLVLVGRTVYTVFTELFITSVLTKIGYNVQPI